MSFFTIATEYVTSAATDLACIGTAIDEAGLAAASATTSVLAAGGDEVSAGGRTVFSRPWNPDGDHQAERFD